MSIDDVGDIVREVIRDKSVKVLGLLGLYEMSSSLIDTQEIRSGMDVSSGFYILLGGLKTTIWLFCSRLYYG